MAAGTLTRSQNGAQQQPQYNPVGLEVIEMVVVMMVIMMMVIMMMVIIIINK